MDDIVDLWVSLEDAVERWLIRDIHLVKLRPLACDELDSVYAFFRGVVEGVNDNYFVVGLEEGENRERADVTGATMTGVSRSLVESLVSGGVVKVVYPVTRTDPTGMVVRY